MSGISLLAYRLLSLLFCGLGSEVIWDGGSMGRLACPFFRLVPEGLLPESRQLAASSTSIPELDYDFNAEF